MSWSWVEVVVGRKFVQRARNGDPFEKDKREVTGEFRLVSSQGKTRKGPRPNNKGIYKFGEKF